MRPGMVLLGTCCCTAWLLLMMQFARAENKDDEEASAPKFNLDTDAVRDAIAEILRDGRQGEGDDDGGYAEAAQEYLEHVQSLLAAVKSPTEVYIREQFADLETLEGLLAGLEATIGRPLTPTAVARLVGQLVKGPARQLLLNGDGSRSAVDDRLADATAELRRFLVAPDESAATADRLRSHADGLPAGSPTRDYLDGVIDRVLELDGKKAKFTVEYAEGSKPKVTRAADDDDGGTLSSSSSADADADGRGLFDQVLRRLAAASVAERLRPASDTMVEPTRGQVAAAISRIEELRARKYRPAGLEVILETIEQSLEKPT